MKKGLIYFVAIVAIIVGIIASIPGFLNWNEYKTEVTDTIYSQTGHRINIGGNLVVRLLPSPALAAGDITLLDPTGAPFLKLDSLGINVGFIALVMGRIEAKSLVLKGGVLTLERNADGIANWQFLLPEENEATPSNADDMRFDHVSIDDLEVHYNDAVLGRTDVFKNIDAVLRADSAKGPFSINSSYSYGGVGFELEATSGRIETSRSFPLSLNLIVAGQNPGINFQATVVLDGAASAASGQFKAAGGNLGEVAAGLMLLANGTEPDEFPLNLDKGFELSAPLVLTKARITARSFALKVGETTGEGELLVSPEAEGGATADVSLKLNSVTVENWRQENVSLASTTTVASPTIATSATSNQFKINYKLEVGLVNYAGEVARRTSAKGYFDGTKLRVDEAASLLPGNTEVKLSGGFNVGANPVFRGNLDLNSNNIRTSLTWLGQDLSEIPTERLKGFSLRSIINVGLDSFAISGATGQLDGIQYSGNMAVEGNGEPIYKADISLSNLDIEKYFPPKQQTSGDGRTWAETTKAIEDVLSPLQGLSAVLKLKADKFSVGDARFTDFNLDSRLAENRLTIASFSTTDFKGVKGNLSGTVEGIGSTPRFNLSMDMESPSLAALTRWAGVELPVDVYKLAAVSLKGHVDGTLSQVNLNIEGRAAHANYSLNGYLGGLSPTPQQMDVRISVSGDDHQDFIRRMDLPLDMHGDGMGFTVAGGLKGTPDALESNLTVDIIGGRMTMVGMIDTNAEQPTFNLEVEANHARFMNVSDALGFGFSPNGDRLGRFQLIANISGGEGVYQSSDMVGLFGPTRYGLDMRYDDNGVRPKLSGTLSIDGLPLSRFLGNSSTGATAVKAAGGRRWSRNPFELNWMREIDIDIGFDGQEISYDKYRYMEPQFKARLENGVLNITDFKGKMFGGRVLGQLRMDVNNVPKGSVAITMEEASLKQALEASAAISPATGSLSLRSDVSFSGISQYDAVSSLNGNVEIWAQNGVIKGIDIDRISRRLARLNSLPDFLSLLGNSLGGGETPFGNIRTNFVGERGVFSARNITADIEGADVDGRMRLDLPQWTMTGTGSIKFNEVALPATAPQTREVRDATGQITIEEIAAPPVRDVPPIGVDIAGDIDNPTINYRTDRLRAFMGERFASSLLDSITGGEGGIGAIFGIPTPTQTPTQTQPQEAPAQEPEVDPVDPAGRVDPADVIIDTLLDLLQPRPQPEQTPDDD